MGDHHHHQPGPDPFRPPPTAGLSPADAAEVGALARILHALACYRAPALAEVGRWEAAAAALPPHHADVLGGRLAAKAAAGRAAVDANGAFLTALVDACISGQCGLGPGMAPALEAAARLAAAAAAAGVRPSGADVEKVGYVLRNAARDWSGAGAGERAACYGRIVDALVEELRPPPPATAAEGGGGEGGGAAPAGHPPPPPPARPRVLVPGAGLARLALDLNAAGFRVEANEHSFFMLLASAFILNGGLTPAAPALIHPWALSPSNRLADGDQFRGVAVPDADPGALASGGGPGGLAMVAGEFTAVYGRAATTGGSGGSGGSGGAGGAPPPSTFDAVATAFFLDTAPNPLAYIDAIASCLAPGGLWVNCGPLLWHWAGGEDDGCGGGGGGTGGAATAAAADPDPGDDRWPHSLELSLEDVLVAADAAGFALVRPVEVLEGVPFNEDGGSMLVTSYRVAFWVMRKRVGGEE